MDEIQSTVEDHFDNKAFFVKETTMLNGPQLHLMLNHFPIVGFVLMAPIMILACFIKSSRLKRQAILAVSILGLLVLPAFWTGEPAEETVENYAGVSEAQIEEHEEAAELGLVAALVSSGLAASALLLTRKNDSRMALVMPIVTAAVLATSGVMAWVGHEGGKIRHPEITEGDTSAARISGGVADAERTQRKDSKSDDDD